MRRLKLIFAGSGAFGLPTLRSLLEAEHEIEQVISQPDRPAGRGRQMTPTPVAQLALERHLPLMRTANINAESLPEVDAMVVIALGQKIGPKVVHYPKWGSINLHASILPRHRGAAPVNWAILSGDAVTGNSVIRLAERMDAGAVLAQSQLTIGAMETAGELHDRLSEDGPALVNRVLEALSQGSAIETPQDEALATSAPKLSREMAMLDFTRPATELVRRIHGLYPWPGCRVELLDAEGVSKGQMTLVRAKNIPCDECGRWSLGEICSTGSVVAGADSVFEVIEVQPQSKRPMSLDAFRRGHSWCAGMRLRAIG